jgi:hypothetical protein
MNWHQEEIQKLDRRTREMLTFHGQRHARAVVDRLHVLRKGGRSRLMQIEGAFKAEVKRLVE